MALQTTSTVQQNIPHPLHKKIGLYLKNIVDDVNKSTHKDSKLVIYRDSDCGGIQHLPFFLPGAPSNSTEVTNVDIIITKDDEVVFVCEIEESDRTPIRLYGKFYSLLHSKKCRLNDGTKLYFGAECTFVQIVSKIGWDKPNKNGFNLSQKIAQSENIEKSIKSTFFELSSISVFGATKYNYHLLRGAIADFIPLSQNYIELTNIINQL